MLSSLVALITHPYRAVARHVTYGEVMDLFNERPHHAWSRERQREFLGWRMKIKRGKHAQVLTEINEARHTARHFEEFGEWLNTTARLMVRLRVYGRYA